MTISGGGPINLDIIRGEFGGSKPDAISEYYRNGGLVPNESPGDIPESGVIKWSDFYDSSSIIPPPIEIGELLLSQSFTGTPATGLGKVYDETYTFNPLHDNATYKVNWYMTATATYGFTFGEVNVDVNGDRRYGGRLGGGPTLGGNRTWFRDFSGQRNRSSDNLILGFGDEVRVRMSVGTRDSNRYTPNHTAFYFEIERIA